jgi:PAS domain S-box-containing protein
MSHSTDFLANVLKHVAVGISVQNATGKLVYVNDAAARSVGFSSADEMCKTPSDEILKRFEILDESRKPFSFDRLPGRRTLKGEPNAEAVVCYRTLATGEERWSAIKSQPINNERGEVEFAVNAWYDVTTQYMQGK